jgi:hypothetical protein
VSICRNAITFSIFLPLPGELVLWNYHRLNFLLRQAENMSVLLTLTCHEKLNKRDPAAEKESVKKKEFERQKHDVIFLLSLSLYKLPVKGKLSLCLTN